MCKLQILRDWHGFDPDPRLQNINNLETMS